MSARLSRGRIRSIHEFIRANQGTCSIKAMCRLLCVARSGFCGVQPIFILDAVGHVATWSNIADVRYGRGHMQGDVPTDAEAT